MFRCVLVKVMTVSTDTIKVQARIRLRATASPVAIS